MTKALLVDYGGVLTTPVVASFAAFCAAEHIDVDRFRTVVLDAAHSPGSVFARVEIGALTQEQFDVELAQLLRVGCGVAVESAGLKERLFARTRLDETMVNAVRTARDAGVRTALVSNSWGGTGYPHALFAEIFDVTIISGDVGLRKPDAAIYELAASRTGVDANACVFVDDFRVNVEGARAIGMTGILHRSPHQTIALLESELGIECERATDVSQGEA